MCAYFILKYTLFDSLFIEYHADKSIEKNKVALIDRLTSQRDEKRIHVDRTISDEFLDLRRQVIELPLQRKEQKSECVQPLFHMINQEIPEKSVTELADQLEKAIKNV